MQTVTNEIRNKNKNERQNPAASFQEETKINDERRVRVKKQRLGAGKACETEIKRLTGQRWEANES